MPKKDNVKKNVSKQVKKPKNKEGGGMFKTIFSRKKKTTTDVEQEDPDPEITNTIKIGFDEALLNDANIKKWDFIKRMKLKEHIDNDYFIDTFLSKKILEVLKSYKDEFNIYYKKINSTMEIDLDKVNCFNCFSVHYTSINIIKPESNLNIDDTNINNLNTFATSRTIEQHNIGVTNKITIIEFPTILLIQLTKKNNEPIPLKELATIKENINERINEKINSGIKKLMDEAKKKNELINEESKRNDEEQKIIKNKLIEYNNYLRKFNINNKILDNSWDNFFNINNLDIIKNIINKLETCESQTDESQNEDVGQMGGRTNKKRPKKEFLGKIMCIYKIPGDRKEYVRHKGKLITIKDYKELMKKKN